MTKKTFLSLLTIFLLAFILRVFYLPKHALSFHYDMARDAFAVHEILSGDIKVLGPPTSTPGLFHGVFYYYLLAPFYLIGRGSPLAPAYFLSAINSSLVFLIYFFVFDITKNKRSSLLASLLFAVSFEATQYAPWLSNPSIAVWTVFLAYFGLWSWLKNEKPWAPLLAGIGLGLSIQSNFIYAYHVIPFAFWLFIKRKDLDIKSLAKFAAASLLSVSTMILAELKFGLGAAGASEGLVKGLTINIENYLKQVGDIAVNSLLPHAKGTGAFLFILILASLLYIYRKKKLKLFSWPIFLITILISHMPASFLGGSATPHIGTGIGVFLVIAFAFILDFLSKKQKLLVGLLLSIFLLSNLVTIFKVNKNGQTLFVIQDDLVLANELRAIDYTYQGSGGDSFSINTLTNPLWINSTWAYLYSWYGNKNYGFVPSWHGRDQVGVPGENVLGNDEVSKYFFITEPPEGIPGGIYDSEVSWEESKFEFTDKKEFGEITVWTESKRQ